MCGYYSIKKLKITISLKKLISGLVFKVAKCS